MFRFPFFFIGIDIYTVCSSINHSHTTSNNELTACRSNLVQQFIPPYVSEDSSLLFVAFLVPQHWRCVASKKGLPMNSSRKCMIHFGFALALGNSFVTKLHRSGLRAAVAQKAPLYLILSNSCNTPMISLRIAGD